MRIISCLAAFAVPLCGCVVTPDGGYGQAQSPAGYYAQPGYPPPPPGYAQPPGYVGYQDYAGQPVYYDGGVPYPLVLFGGEWGYYDHDRHWHRAPEDAHRRIEERRANEGQARPEAPRFVPAAAPARAAPATAPPQRQDNHDRRRDCPRDQPHC